MKSHYWIGHLRQDDTVEIIIKDASGKRLERWEFNLRDKKAAAKVFKALKESYGFEMEKIRDDRDLDWLRRD